jgi:glyoxylate reductase
VAQIAVGFDNINRADANKYKIPFTNTADGLTEATAEFAFFMMGMLARKMWQSERLVREQKWPSWHPFLPFLGDEITGKTIAVIGTGRIGLAMIKKCSGFDMNILCYDPAYQNHEVVAAIQELMDLRHARGIQKEKTWIKYVEFENALRDADYVTIHVPLLREGETDKPTYHLINDKTLKLMKPTAYLVNSSRGPVVDEKALAKALKEKVIAGAALDVFEKEPLPPDSPLYGTPNLVITPHTSWSSDRVTERGLALFIDNLRRYLAGEPLENVVDLVRVHRVEDAPERARIEIGWVEQRGDSGIEGGAGDAGNGQIGQAELRIGTRMNYRPRAQRGFPPEKVAGRASRRSSPVSRK